MLSKLKIYWTLRWKRPVRFRKWVELEEVKEKISKAIQEKEQQFPDLVFSYLSIAFNVHQEYFTGRYWEEVIGWFYSIVVINLPPSTLPIISTPSGTKKEKDTWDYPGRTWHLYAHLLAKNYGWSLEYIANLKVEEAIAKVQEILTDEQLEREFLWGMSDKSVSYNARTKTSKFHELPRPYWMKKKIEKPRVMTMPASILPIGNVDTSAIPQEFKGKPIDIFQDKEPQT